MNEDKAIAVLLANIKRNKKKASKLTVVAKACEFLIDKWGLKKTADFFKVSRYQLTQINKINKLDKNIKKIIDGGKLGIDSSYQIWRLKENLREEAAEESVDLTSHEVRQMVHLLRKNEEMSVQEAKQITKKDLRKSFNIIEIPLSVQTYTQISKIAKQNQMPVRKLISKIVEEYVQRK